MDKAAAFPQSNTPFPHNPHIQNAKLKHRHSVTGFALAVANHSRLPSLSSHLVCDGNEINSLHSVKLIHAHMVKQPDKWSCDQAKNLITCYANFGDVRSAALVFLVGLARSDFGWISFWKELGSFRELPVEILEAFHDLHRKQIVFEGRIFTVSLGVCTFLINFWLGVVIHACLIKRGLEVDALVQCALMNFYESCQGIECANQVFSEIPERSDLVWNEAIKLNIKNQPWIEAFEMFRDMQDSCMRAKETTISRLLQNCGKVKALREGKQIHAHVLRSGLIMNLTICNALIIMYTKNEELKVAKAVFDSMEEQNLSSWNSIIYAYASLGFVDDAWNHFHMLESCNIRPDIITWNSLLSGHALNGLYEDVMIILHRMQISGFQPNSSSITCALQSVTDLGLRRQGKEIHAYVIRHYLDYDVYVCTSLVDMYVKIGCLDFARVVFHNLKNRNICAWNSLISGHWFKGYIEDAENLISEMEKAGIKPDIVTWNGVVSGYSMWGQTEKALDTINRIKLSGLTPNVVSWTALISGCSQRGKFRESLEFFILMQEEGISPNRATLSSLLRACGGLSLLQKGKEIHCHGVKKGMVQDVYVATAIIDMYCKSGDLRSAQEVFSRIEKRSLASWNCMIMGFAMYGHGTEAISLFHEMCSDGISPDPITFTAVLSGCKNTGLISEGWKFYDRMSRDYGMSPAIEHCCCIVDLLGRAGYLDEAWDFIKSMPLKPDATIWGALLCSSRIHKNVTYGEIAAKHLFELEPNSSANYVLMMNLYAALNRWKDFERIKELMNDKRMKQGEASSWIQIGQTVHYFAAEQSTHPDMGEIYFELYQLISQIKKLGYVPDISCVYQDIEDAEKEKVLLSHTEKLAITYGLMKTRGSAPIRVIKNSRICTDCHTLAKYISLAPNREIFLKDGVRFHHFRDGNCSCKDCW